MVTAASAANFQAAINNQNHEFNMPVNGDNDPNNYGSSSKINFYNQSRDIERATSSALYKKSL